MTEFKTMFDLDLNNDGIKSTNLLNEMDCYAGEAIFNANGTGTFKGESYAEFYAYPNPEDESDTDYNVICYEETDISGFNWVLYEDNIIITYEDDSDVLYLQKINNTSFSLFVSEGFFVEEEETGDYYTEDLTMVFTKQ